MTTRPMKNGIFEAMHEEVYAVAAPQVDVVVRAKAKAVAKKTHPRRHPTRKFPRFQAKAWVNGDHTSTTPNGLVLALGVFVASRRPYFSLLFSRKSPGFSQKISRAFRDFAKAPRYTT